MALCQDAYSEDLWSGWYLELGTATDWMCNATRCCPSVVAKINPWHVFVSFLIRGSTFTSVECMVFVCICVTSLPANTARGCCALRWHAVRLAVLMGISINQQRFYFFCMVSVSKIGNDSYGQHVWGNTTRQLITTSWWNMPRRCGVGQRAQNDLFVVPGWLRKDFLKAVFTLGYLHIYI